MLTAYEIVARNASTAEGRPMWWIEDDFGRPEVQLPHLDDEDITEALARFAAVGVLPAGVRLRAVEPTGDPARPVVYHVA